MMFDGLWAPCLSTLQEPKMPPLEALSRLEDRFEARSDADL